MDFNAIEGKNHLVKSEHGSVINTDSNAYYKAKQRKLKLKQEEASLANIETMLRDISVRLSCIEDKLK